MTLQPDTKVGHILVVDRASPRTWNCICDCGEKTVIDTKEINSTRKKGWKLYCGRNCPLLKKAQVKRMAENRSVKTTSGGKALLLLPKGHPERATYITWTSMKARCTYTKHTRYKYYGGKGIMVCDRWLGEDGYKNFRADMGVRPKGFTIDRIRSNGNYEPDNCKWASYKEQNRQNHLRRTR